VNDDRLAELLHDAVADVEPADRIHEIRERTANPARSAARPWLYAAGATVLATAATVTAFAVLGNEPTRDAAPSHGHEAETFLVPAYFIGDTPQGERLYREFDEVEGHDELEAALARIGQPAADPDYRTAWGPESFESVTLREGSIDVEFDHWMADPDELSLQQVVYTLQGTLQSTLPVRFLQDGEPLMTVDALPQLDVLSLVSISDPAERNSYEGSFIARGRASSYEANVPWEIRDGDTVVKHGFATAEGWMDRLYEWKTDVDLTGIAPGVYTFVAMTDDPSAGEGAGPFTDTRTITVR
jgi:hypothetical protein